jgi:hypothetical protein
MITIHFTRTVKNGSSVVYRPEKTQFEFDGKPLFSEKPLVSKLVLQRFAVNEKESKRKDYPKKLVVTIEEDFT